jgi:import inner membrane translocase subunit TIM17
MRAPVLGGNFGVWGGLFSTFDCAVKGIRKKEDPYNAIIAGFFTGGSLAVRGGYKAARNGAIGCAVLLAVIEGVGIAFSKMMAGSTKLEVSIQLDNAVMLLGGRTPRRGTDDEFACALGTTATRQ